MKILFVAMSESVHVARWIAQIADQGWDLHLFSSVDSGIVHPEMKGVTAHVPLHGQRRWDSSVTVKGLPLFNDFVATGVNQAFSRLGGHFERQSRRLAQLVRKLKPDVIHSMELQHGGYLTMEARKQIPEGFPRWIAANWGSDIYLYGRLAEHQPRLREVLSHCDFYFCECERDIPLAEKLGLRGTALPVFPNTGGFDLDALSRLRDPRPPSQRRLIMLKGYQTWAGRALVGLRALERCKDLLAGYELMIHSASAEVELASRLFSQSTGVPVSIIPLRSTHEEILRQHGRARISIGLSISDGISTSFLEALVMGSFPIQSSTACANEWVDDGVTALLTPAEDPDVVERAIRRALTDDALVDAAAEKNWQTAQQRLEKRSIQRKTLELYARVLRT